MTIFRISIEDDKKVALWLKETVYPNEIARQRGHVKEDHPDYQTFKSCWEMGYPYEGAIGGGLTYCFTKMSIGAVVKVKYGDEVLDITDYDSW